MAQLEMKACVWSVVLQTTASMSCLFETFSPVDVMLGIGKHLGRRGQGSFTHIAEGDDILAFHRPIMCSRPYRRHRSGQRSACCLGHQGPLASREGRIDQPTPAIVADFKKPTAGNRRGPHGMPP